MIDLKAMALVAKSLDAAVEEARWEQVADLLCDALDLRSCSFMSIKPDLTPAGFLASSEILRINGNKLFARTMQGDYRDDLDLIAGSLKLPPHVLLRERDFHGVGQADPLPPSSLRDFMRNEFGIYERDTIKLSEFGPAADLVVLHTSADKPTLMDGDRDAIRLLAPILAQSIRMKRIFEALKQRFNSALGALDRLGIGSLLVDGKGDIISINSCAQRILESKDGLYKNPRGQLACNDEACDRDLRQGCLAAFETAKGDGLHAQTVLAVKRRSGEPDYLLTISPVADPLAEIEPGFRSTLVFVVDPSDDARLSVEGVQHLGQLTRAEVSVLKLMVSGASTREISDLRDVSEETVRRQIKSILAKLNYRNRADVIRLAVATRLPLDAPEDAEGMDRHLISEI
ncbi:helix-turn-helix transcriptional regulator [Limibacillus halophilus]